MLDERTGAALATVNVGRQPEMLAVDEATGRVFVANRGDDMVSMIDPT